MLNLNPNSKTFGYEDVDVKVSTNYEAGYVLSMTTADNSTDLKRDNTADGVNASINTLTATSPTTTGYTDSDFSNCTSANCMNKWGYKNGLSNNYFPFTSGATVLSNTLATNEDTTTLRFAAKIDYAQPAGAYNNELIFTATANPITYNITYYDLVGASSSNLNDSGLTWSDPTTGTAKVASYEPIAEQNNTSGTSSYVNLNPSYISGHSTPTRHTYSFAGWCLDPNKTVTADQDSNNKVTAYHNPSTQCNGTIYQTGDPIPLTPNDSNNISIYAMWTPTTFAEAGVVANSYMQDFGNSCANVTPNQFTTMRDSREPTNDPNRNTYIIIKLMDGRCWMADNLSFDAYAYKDNITASNTHIAGTTTDINNIITSFKSGNRSAGDKYATSGINSNSTYASGGNWTASYSYSDPLINKSGKCDPNVSVYTNYQCLVPYHNADYTTTKVIDKYGTPASDSSGTANVTYNFGPGGYMIGTYYNYCTATLGSYCYGSGTSAGSSATGDATVADICPAG